MIHPLDLVVLSSEDDVLYAARRARTVAGRLGLPAFAQARVATTVSELARNAFLHGGGGAVYLGARLSGQRQFLSVEVRDRGAGFDLAAALSGPDPLPGSVPQTGRGLRAVRRLMGEVTVRALPEGGAGVYAECRLPPASPLWTPERLTRLSESLAGSAGHSPLELARHDNAQLLTTLQREQDANRRLTALQRAAAELLSARDRAEVARAVLHSGVGGVGAVGGWVALHRQHTPAGEPVLEGEGPDGDGPPGDPWTLAADTGADWRQLGERALHSPELNLSGAPPEGGPTILSGEALGRALSPADLADTGGEPLSGLASVPLRLDGQLLGRLLLGFRRSPALEAADLEFLAALAGFGAQALDRARLSEQERHVSAELERRVEARTARLQELNVELEAFAYSMSRDLREPLRHMQGFLQLLTRQLGDKLDERGRRHVEIIQSAGERMNGLIDDLVQFSQFGRRELQLSDVRLDLLLVQVRSDLETSTRGRTVRWQVGPLPTVRGDFMLLRTVLAQLLHNALKFTRSREVAVIEVSAQAEEPEAGLVRIRVRDNGTGFDPAQAERLFTLFQRLHRDEAVEGAGVGLANVRRIVARHGGTVSAEGRPGEGATFSFTLPLVRAAQSGSSSS